MKPQMKKYTFLIFAVLFFASSIIFLPSAIDAQITCPAGQIPNPFNQNVCIDAPASPESCAAKGQVYNPNLKICGDPLPSPESCAAKGQVYNPNLKICGDPLPDPGSDTGPGSGSDESPESGAPTTGGGTDGGIFTPLVTCIDEAPICSVCQIFQMVWRVVQFLFYAIMLPLVAIAFIIGGIILLTAAGNETKITRGKSIVWNTFLGFLVAFAAWLVISTVIVNITPSIGGIDYPDDVNIKWYQFPDCTEGTEVPLPLFKGSGSGGTQPQPDNDDDDGDQTGPPVSGGRCAPITDAGNPCSVDNLSNACFGSNAENASRACHWESNGDPTIPSGPDKCADGTTFSWGLYQINVIANADKIAGGACTGVFNPNGTARPQGDCLQCQSGSPTNGLCGSNNICVKWSCTVNGGGGVNNEKYKACVSSIQNPATNIGAACQLSGDGSQFNDWKIAQDKCNLP
ncbi:MAG: hypothetical protein Q8O83_03305 [bacterium]|nr:hypothetical protein [bacterium]